MRLDVCVHTALSIFCPTVPHSLRTHVVYTPTRTPVPADLPRSYTLLPTLPTDRLPHTPHVPCHTRIPRHYTTLHLRYLHCHYVCCYCFTAPRTRYHSGPILLRFSRCRGELSGPIVDPPPHTAALLHTARGHWW